MSGKKKAPMSKINVIQNPDEELPTEIIAQSIQDISDGMKKIKAGRLNSMAIIFLIAKASGVPQGEVARVLDAMEDLERKYLKPKGKT